MRMCSNACALGIVFLFAACGQHSGSEVSGDKWELYSTEKKLDEIESKMKEATGLELLFDEDSIVFENQDLSSYRDIANALLVEKYDGYVFDMSSIQIKVSCGDVYETPDSKLLSEHGSGKVKVIGRVGTENTNGESRVFQEHKVTAKLNLCRINNKSEKKHPTVALDSTTLQDFKKIMKSLADLRDQSVSISKGIAKTFVMNRPNGAVKLPLFGFNLEVGVENRSEIVTNRAGALEKLIYEGFNPKIKKIHSLLENQEFVKDLQAIPKLPLVIFSYVGDKGVAWNPKENRNNTYWTAFPDDLPENLTIDIADPQSIVKIHDAAN